MGFSFFSLGSNRIRLCSQIKITGDVLERDRLLPFQIWLKFTMKLRIEGEPLSGKMTTNPLIVTDGGPVLLVNEDPFSPEEADFFLESATEEELEMLE
jgi:hypothetical protein